MKIAIVIGTRPEIIKLSPIIRQMKFLKLNYFVLHTGQHYSYNMDRIFFKELDLPDPKYNLNVGSGSHGEQTGKMLIKIENVLKNEKPDIVLVQGDTNTTLAGALAATKLGIHVGHVEAGLRSYDRSMPEEINRILVDHCSDYLFAPTSISKENLLREGISQDKVFVTGNTIVDAVYQNLEITNRTRNALNDLNLKPKMYFLATIHRQENVDSKSRFSDILKGLEEVSKEFGIPVIYPVHPRSKKRMSEFCLNPKEVNMIEPVDYLTFLQLESKAKLVLTDSGGVQEEACILKVPCVTLRDNTERPETLRVGANILAGTTPSRILKCVRKMVAKEINWRNPFGDGNASKRIIAILRRIRSIHN